MINVENVFIVHHCLFSLSTKHTKVIKLLFIWFNAMPFPRIKNSFNVKLHDIMLLHLR